MAFTLRYNTLFEVAILHHYFLDDGQQNFEKMDAGKKLRMLNRYRVKDFLRISPTAACKNLLNSHHWQFRITDSGFMLGARAADPQTTAPFISPSDDLVLRFHIDILDPEFINYTALPLRIPAGHLYYFTNQTELKPRIFPSLSATAPLFSGGTTYLPGDQLVNNAAAPAKLFIAKKKNNKNPALAATPATLWQPDEPIDGKPLSYANRNDLLQAFGSMFIYEIPVAGKEPHLTLTNKGGKEVGVKTSLQTGPKNMIKADLQLLTEGIYTVKLQTPDNSYSETFSFYHASEQPGWGLVEIAIKSADTAYNLSEANGNLRSPGFRIRFKNRSTFWRYLDHDQQTLDEAGPFPLTRYGFIETASRPNPSTSMIRPEDEQYFSEIFIPSLT